MQCHWDGDVTPLGLRQVDDLTERFRAVKVDALYSSDLYRARFTASAIARTHPLPIRTDTRLREISVGPWETEFFGNVAKDEPEAFRQFIADPDRFSHEGAETFRQVGERMREALMEIVRRHDGESVAVVSHGVAIRALMSRITDIPLSDIQRLPICRNTAVTRLVYDDGRFSLDYYNDHSHLSEAATDLAASTPSFRHEYIDPRREEEYYRACYADAWQAAHGDLRGYDADAYFDSAVEHYEDDGGSVCHIYDRERSAGLVDMDSARGRHANYGWISLLYLEPEYRGQGLGIQLLARAIVKYEREGRRAIRLHVSEDNEAAMGFYRHWGFEQLSWEPGRTGARLWLMEKKLGGRRDV